MKIIKRNSSDIALEEAHGGSGARRVYANALLTQNDNLEAITHGYLPAGATFDWHEHDGIDEIMIVVHGKGIVGDRDGEYEYGVGDTFIFPANTEHMITNPTDHEHEMIFVRVKR
jgi:quercetin dioxygenase-like cupin family protein